MILITLVWILVGNSIGLSIRGIEDLRTRRWIHTIVLIVAIAINLVKLKMSITTVFFALYPLTHFVQFSLIFNAVKLQIKYPVYTDIIYLLPGKDSEQLLGKNKCSLAAFTLSPSGC